MENWQYTGDVNLKYGGLYVNCDLDHYEWGYLECTEICDLDGACGATGMVLIEKFTVNLSKERVVECLETIGQTVEDLLRMDTERAMLTLAYAFRSYGYCDPRSDNYHAHSIIVQTVPGASMKFDGWTAEKFIHPKDLRGFVESQWLE